MTHRTRVELLVTGNVEPLHATGCSSLKFLRQSSYFSDDCPKEVEIIKVFGGTGLVFVMNKILKIQYCQSESICWKCL